ncbi:MAG: signal peptide peptidase SppA [Betaproteobacteria bacterium]|nr:signal peptide peptidase SppA [Betaproteobacteria bacterium]
MLNRLKQFALRLGGVLELTRRISLNLLFLGFVGSALWFAFGQDEASLQEKTVLVISLQGRLVEAAASEDKEQWLLNWVDDEQREVVLPTLVESLRQAAKDPKISKALLLTDGFEGGGLASMDELAIALNRFRESGKPIIAWGTRFDQRQYRIASQANEVLMHPMGELIIEGFGRRRNYYRDALDRLGITPHLIRVGEYKSAAEPWVANRPSSQSLQAEAHVIGDLWKRYAADLEKARGLEAGRVEAIMASLPGALQEQGGDAAALALDWKLVDGLMAYPDLRERLIREGVKESSYRSFRQISASDYASRVASQSDDDDEHIGILVVEGEIRERGSGSQIVGGRETAEKIRKAAEDEKLKALVLRVDSPGGSAVGSEFIRQALEAFRQTGKPVVVSMGDLAASGGYWIALSADRIIAHPSSITGSIGVYGLLPTAQGLMDKLSIRTGGYQSHWLAGGYDPRVDLDPRMKSLIESRIQHIYKDFIELTAKARGQSKEQIGGLDAAILASRNLLAEAKQSSGQADSSAVSKNRRKSADALAVRYLKSEGSRFGQWLRRWFGAMLQSAGLRSAHPVPELTLSQDPVKGLLGELYREGQWAVQWLGSQERWSAQAHCLCSLEP